MVHLAPFASQLIRPGETIGYVIASGKAGGAGGGAGCVWTEQAEAP